MKTGKAARREKKKQTKDKHISHLTISARSCSTLHWMLSLSLSPFLSPRVRAPPCARTRPPRSRARTREPARRCAAQEPLTVPVRLAVIAAWRLRRSAGCLRRGHLPPPVTAPTPAEHPGAFPPFNFCDVWRFFFCFFFCRGRLFQDYVSIGWENPVEAGVWLPTWGLMARLFVTGPESCAAPGSMGANFKSFL